MSAVIWSKTDAGRSEMRERALVKERAQRNLLLVIDGVKSEDMLLGALAGISQADFVALQALGLIAPVRAASPSARSAAPAAPGSADRPAPMSDGPATASSGARLAAPAPPTSSAPLVDVAHFTEALTRLISHELGLRGFVLALAVQKADSVETLRSIAQRALEQIRERKGEAAAAAARIRLFGA